MSRYLSALVASAGGHRLWDQQECIWFPGAAAHNAQRVGERCARRLSHPHPGHAHRSAVATAVTPEEPLLPSARLRSAVV